MALDKLTYGREVNSMFLDTVDDFGLEQQAYEYTRGNHILHIKYHISNTDLETFKQLTLSHFVKTIIALYICVKTLSCVHKVNHNAC